MAIGFANTISGLAIASAVSPKIGEITGYLMGLSTGRLFGDKSMPTLLSVNGQPIRVSVIMSTQHSITAEPTQMTIENGARLSDHVILQPKVITISFEVSNIEDETRYGAGIPDEWSMDSEIDRASNRFNSAELTPSVSQLVNTLQRYNPLGRLGKSLKRGDVAKAVLEQLQEAMEARDPLTLSTLHFTYPNMVITSIDAEEPAPFKGKLEFTVVLTEVRLVELKQAGRTNSKVAGAAPKKAAVPALNKGNRDPDKMLDYMP